MDNTTVVPTYTSGNTRTTIDYVFAHKTLQRRILSGKNWFLPNNWTDHCMLTMDMVLPKSIRFGPSTWRMNSPLLESDHFQKLLQETLDQLSLDLSSDTNMDKQTQWDTIKHVIQILATQSSKALCAKRHRKRFDAQSHREAIVSQLANTQQNNLELQSQLREVELEISKVEKEIKALSIRSATRWYERGERSNSYFFQTIKTRSESISISRLRNQKTGQTSEKLEDMLDYAKDFYRNLFEPDPIDVGAVQILLDSIDDSSKLTEEDLSRLTLPVSLFELYDAIKRCPKGRNPGLDGLPFELYPQLLQHKFTRDLLQEVMCEAMQGKFPPSWTKTKLILLYKKGDAWMKFHP